LFHEIQHMPMNWDYQPPLAGVAQDREAGSLDGGVSTKSGDVGPEELAAGSPCREAVSSSLCKAAMIPWSVSGLLDAPRLGSSGAPPDNQLQA
jgi:hypothetical protein